MIDLPEEIHDLLEDANLRFDKVSNKVENSWEYVESKQPDNFSWITFDTSYIAIATDMSTGMIYKDSDDFRNELHKFIDAFFSDEIIEHFRGGRLTDISVHLGPQKSYENINEEMGLERFPSIKRSGKKDI